MSQVTDAKRRMGGKFVRRGDGSGGRGGWGGGGDCRLPALRNCQC